MKKFFLLCFFISFFIGGSTGAVALLTLKGSFVDFPKELRELSLLNGAIALETGLLRRLILFGDFFGGKKNPAISFLKEWFYVIPGTKDVKLSKKKAQKISENDWDALVGLLVGLFLAHKTGENLPAYKKKKLVLVAKDHQVYDVARYAILGVLWYLVKEELVKGKSASVFVQAVNNRLKKILQSPEQHAFSSEVKENISAWLGEFSLVENNKSFSLEDGERVSDFIKTSSKSLILNDLNYEDLVIFFLLELNSAKKHPEMLSKVNDAMVQIKGKRFSFPDCVETVIRNLINILCFDKETGKVSADLLKSNFSNVRSDVIDFYKKYPLFLSDPANPMIKTQKSQEAYNEWASLLVDIPDFEYVNDQYRFEMKAYFGNLIRAVTYVLGLDWFDESSKLSSIDIVKMYLQKFVALFGSIEPGDIQLKDQFGLLKIKDQQGQRFIIDLSFKHASISYQVGERPSIFIASDMYEKYPSLWLLLDPANWSVIPSSSMPFFAHPIDDASFIVGSLVDKLTALPLDLAPILFASLNGAVASNVPVGKGKVILYKLLLKDNEVFQEKYLNEALFEAGKLLLDRDECYFATGFFEELLSCKVLMNLEVKRSIVEILLNGIVSTWSTVREEAAFIAEQFLATYGEKEFFQLLIEIFEDGGIDKQKIRTLIRKMPNPNIKKMAVDYFG